MAVCLDYQIAYIPRSQVNKDWWKLLLACVFLLGALLLRVAVKVETTSLAYQLAKEQQFTVELDMQRRDLELQLSVLMRADTLTEQASRRLGLKDFNPQYARKIKMGGFNYAQNVPVKNSKDLSKIKG